MRPSMVEKREIVPLLTAVEAAARLGTDRNGVYYLCGKRNGLKSYKVGGLIRFKPEDIEEYLARKTDT